MTNPQNHPWCKPFTPLDLKSVLDLTIDCDDANKVCTFLCLLSAYTRDSQFNISFNAPSSTGKSYIPTQIAELFPPEDVRAIAYCSPKAFFHEVGKVDKKKRCVVDLSKKILIFLDQPHNELLARLRPMLSHDSREISLKITDRSKSSGLRTKDVLLKGYPSVIFCTAGLQIDEQEATRFLLLSPEMHQGKLQKSVESAMIAESDKDAHNARINSNLSRTLLKRRIEAIKKANIDDIRVEDHDKVMNIFFNSGKPLLPRHQRDVKRVIALVKAFALLNLWWRRKDGNAIYANQDDVSWAVELWKHVCGGQDLNLPPYVYGIYKDIIAPLCQHGGVSRRAIFDAHYRMYGRHADPRQFSYHILPMLESSGLIDVMSDPKDKRRQLVTLRGK